MCRAVQIVRAAGIGDIECLFIRREGQPVRLDIIGRHPCHSTGVRVPSIDMAGTDLAVRPPPFIIHQDAVGRVGKPDRSVRPDHNIIRRIETLAFNAVGKHRDRPVMLGPGDAAGQVFAGDKSSLSVNRVAVRILRWLAKHRYRGIGIIKAHHPVIRDIGPDEIAASGKPGRSFTPSAASPQPFDMGMAKRATSKFRFDDFDSRSLDNAKHRDLPFSVMTKLRMECPSSFGAGQRQYRPWRLAGPCLWWHDRRRWHDGPRRIRLPSDVGKTDDWIRKITPDRVSPGWLTQRGIWNNDTVCPLS